MTSATCRHYSFLVFQLTSRAARSSTPVDAVVVISEYSVRRELPSFTTPTTSCRPRDRAFVFLAAVKEVFSVG